MNCNQNGCGSPALTGFELCWAHADEQQQKTFRDHLQRAHGRLNAHSARGADLPGFVLEDIEFADGDFSHARLTGAFLKNVSFIGCNLTSIDFRGARLCSVKFVNTSLNRANFEGEVAAPAGVRPALVNTSLNRANFEGTELDACEFGVGSNEADPRLESRQANFGSATFTGKTRFVRVNLQEASFESSAFEGPTTFDDCHGPATRFTHARAQSISFHRCVLDRSDFREVVFDREEERSLFKGTPGSEVGLTNCDFRGAILQASGVKKTFESVPLSGSSTHSARRSVWPVKKTFESVPLSGSNFAGAHLDHCEFAGTDGDPMKALSCDFEDADLDGAVFKNVDLRGSSYAGCAVSGTRFIGADISGARLNNLVATNVTFDSVIARAASIRACHLTDCVVTGGVFDGADFSRGSVHGGSFGANSMKGCGFQSVVFDAATRLASDFSEADFSQALLDPVVLDKDSKFEGAIFRDATWHGVAAKASNFKRADFREANLSEGDFTDAELEEAQFGSAIVAGTRFDGAQMHRADLTDLRVGARTADRGGEQPHAPPKFVGARLTGAVLRRCRLQGADLRDADLKQAVVEDGEFQGATLCGADLSFAVFDRCMFNNRSGDRPAHMCGVHAGGASFIAAHFRGVQLAGVDFSGANLQDAVFSGARVVDCDSGKKRESRFSGARLVGTVGPIQIDPASEQCPKCERKPVPGAGRFRHAYINATEYFLEGDTENSEGLPESWDRFRRWINTSLDGRKSTDTNNEEARGSWVAWKNNFSSLGWYDLQSECFVEEQLARSPSARWLHDNIRNHRLQDGISAGVFVIAVVIFLLVGGILYWVAEEVPGTRPLIFAGMAATLLVAPRFHPFLYVLHGFGERPRRIFLNSAATLVVFAAWYWGLADSSHCVSGTNGTTDNFWDALYFSTVTFTTLGYGEFTPYGFSRFLAGCESFAGLLMAALFITALARRTSGR